MPLNMSNIVALSVVFVCSALASAVLIWLLQPLWRRYALAKPNARSSHKVPTPQSGGIVVIAVTVAIVALATAFMPDMAADTWRLAAVLTGAVALAIVGAVDDLHVLEAVPRLLLQTAAVALVIAALPPDLRIIHALPWWVERAIILVGGVWFVNLVNFMDGVDWMTVAEVFPVTAGLALFGGKPGRHSRSRRLPAARGARRPLRRGRGSAQRLPRTRPAHRLGPSVEWRRSVARACSTGAASGSGASTTCRGARTAAATPVMLI